MRILGSLEDGRRNSLNNALEIRKPFKETNKGASLADRLEDVLRAVEGLARQASLLSGQGVPLRVQEEVYEGHNVYVYCGPTRTRV